MIHEPALDGHRPRRMDRRAERAQDADAPVADLVLEAFDDHGAIVRDGARRFELLVEVLPQVARGEGIEGVVRHQALVRRSFVEVADLTNERSEGPPEFERPAGSVPVPERHLAGLPGGGADGHPFERDVLDAPRRRAEHERLAGAALVHHLLVELTHAGAVGQEHTEQPAVGDRAAGRDGEAFRSRRGHGGGR